MSTIGKVIEIPYERDFVWIIEDFMLIKTKENAFYKSPSFYFAGETWYLKCYPNGHTQNQSTGFISLFLMRKSSGPSISLDITLVLKTLNENDEDDKHRHLTRAFIKVEEGTGRPKLISRPKLLERWTELAPSDVLTFICTMKLSYEDASGDEAATCSHCKTTLDADAIQLHERRCMDRPMRCSGCFTAFKLKEWFDHECEMERAEASEKLSQDLQAMVLNGDHSDTIIKVKEVEFQLHRCILAARNSYFHSMFKNDMKEKNTGVVTIDDCMPDIFRIFVNFIYTGKVDQLSVENVCALYDIANMYQEDQLKKECLRFMMKQMSDDTFCDFIILALNYDEKDLFEEAVEYFTSHPSVIVRSVKWQNFVREYPTQANELFIKIVYHYVE